MQISPARRREACLHLIQSKFDTDATIDWFLTKFADDPAVESAQNKEKLVHNIITMGGSGLNQHVNMIAFQQALTDYQSESQRREKSVSEAEITSLKVQVESERDRTFDLQKQHNEQSRQIQQLTEKLAAAERTTYQLEAHAAEPVASI